MEQWKKRKLSWAEAIIVTALLIALSALFAKGLTLLGGTPAGTKTLLPCSSTQVVKPLLDGVIYSNGANLHALNADGRQKWNYLVGVGFDFDANSSGVAAWTGNTLALLDASSGKSLFTGVMDEPIISASMGDTYAAVLIGEDDQNSTLIVMEHGGRQIDKIVLSNMMVLEYGFFSTKGQMLWVMSLDTEGTVPMSQLTTYRPGRMQSGNITDSDQVLYQVMLESPNVYTVGTTYVRTYNYAGVEDTARRKLVYGWYLMDSDGTGSGALMAYAPMAQVGMQASVSDVRMICGDTDRTVRMPFPCYAIAVHGDKVYGFSEQYVMSIGLKDTKASVTQLPIICDNMLGITDGREAVMTSGNEVYLVTLP